MRRSSTSPSHSELRRLFSWLEQDGGNNVDLRQVVAAMPQALFVKDATSRLLMMNPACEAMWGVRFDDIAGTDGTGLCPPEQLRIFHENDRLAFASGETIIEEASLWHAGLQQQRWIISHKHPTYDADGRPHVLIGCCFDITERQRQDTALAEALTVAQQVAVQQQAFTDSQHRRQSLGLRDGLAQNLVALKLDIAMLHARTGDAQPLLHQRTTQALATLDASIDAVRDIINELYPPTLELGLSAAVEWQLQQLERRDGLRCTLRVLDDSAQLEQQRVSALFQLIQSALDYLCPQTRTLHVELALRREQQSISITSDAALASVDADAAGLAALRARLTTLGGQLSVSRHTLQLTLGTKTSLER